MRFRPEASESGPTIALSKRSGGKTPVAASGNAVWAGSESGFTVLRIDPVTGEVVARVPKLQSPHAI
ncbi:MAG: hypothetical protein ICV74_06515, partial [Thermoleophilia bacterium]|nr:hypothetical protein [Thermoleophilia bacterium]